MTNIPRLRAVSRHSASSIRTALAVVNLINKVIRYEGLRTLKVDWHTAVVYQTIYHEYDKMFICTALITFVTSL
jgi:hypothetical protein